MDLDKINNSTLNQAQKPTSNGTSANQGNSNRPRLRKIKRPKQHSGPISTTPAQSNVPQPEVAQNYNLTETKPQSGLIRADHRQNFNNQALQNYPLSYVDDNYQNNDEFAYQENNSIAEFSIKKILFGAIGIFLFGLFIGKMMFSTEQVVRNGLQGVIVNPEVPKGRSRCGVAEKTQGCVLYIMNPQRQELNGRDFYDWAAQLTGRQRFVIETGNMRYSSVKIKPGNIAQLNIPPLQ